MKDSKQRFAAAIMSFYSGDDSAFANRRPENESLHGNSVLFASEEIDKKIATVAEFVNVPSNNREFFGRVFLVKYGAIAHTYKDRKMIEGYGSRPFLVFNFIYLDANPSLNRFSFIGENVHRPRNWKILIFLVLISERLNGYILDVRKNRPENELRINSHVKRRSLSYVFHCSNDARRPLTFVSCDITINLKLKGEPRTFLDFSKSTGFGNCIISRSNRFSSLDKSVFYKKDSPYTKSCGSYRNNRHCPLGVTVSPRIKLTFAGYRFIYIPILVGLFGGV